jgi:hypothetical protein
VFHLLLLCSHGHQWPYLSAPRFSRTVRTPPHDVDRGAPAKQLELVQRRTSHPKEEPTPASAVRAPRTSKTRKGRSADRLFPSSFLILTYPLDQFPKAPETRSHCTLHFSFPGESPRLLHG